MNDNKRKRSVLLIYGENTVPVTVKVPESKADEIRGKFYDLLKSYEKKEIKESVVEKNVECLEVNGTGGFPKIDFDDSFKGKVFYLDGKYRTRLQVGQEMIFFEFSSKEALIKYINEQKI